MRVLAAGSTSGGRQGKKQRTGGEGEGDGRTRASSNEPLAMALSAAADREAGMDAREESLRQQSTRKQTELEC